ncbi:TIGR02300 family protein [bacterium]|nr:TIGR02300 family protein [bacterium]
MKKAAAKTAAAPVTLGTKRTCPKCASKFYDLAKASIQCPKCGTEVDPNAELALFKQATEKKAKPKTMLRDEEDGPTNASEFESVDDLGDDDDASLDELGAKDGGESEDDT